MPEFFNYFDLFRFPVELHMKKRASTYTVLGKFWTLLIFTYIIYSLINSKNFKKKFPNVSNQNLKTQGRSFMNLTKKDLSLAFGVTDEANQFYVDPSIFFFQAKQIHGVTMDGKYEYTEKILQIKLCEASDFEDQTIFENLALNK